MIGTLVGFGCLTLFLCAFGGAFLLARMFREDSAMLPSDLDRAKRFGLPLTREEIRRRTPAVPVDENAAPLFAEAMKAFQKLPANQTSHLFLGTSASLAERQLAARALRSFQPTLRILERAVERPACDFRTDPPFRDASHWAPKAFHYEIAFREMALYVSADCVSKLRWDMSGALKDLNTGLKMARLLPAYSTTMGGWGLIATELGAVRRIWRILLSRPNDLATLDQLGKLVDLMSVPDLYRLMQTDFVVGRETIRTIKSLEEVGLDRNTPASFSRTVDSLYQAPGVKEAYDARYVRTYARLFEALPTDREDWPAIHAAMAKVDKEVFEDKGLDNAVNRALGIGSQEFPLILGMMQSEQRVLKEAVAVLKAHAGTGRYPKTLPIAGPTSIDPIWRQPFTYKADSGGFTISSRGRDFGKDSPTAIKRGNLFQYRDHREPGRIGLAD